jgi:hypothetical protein
MRNPKKKGKAKGGKASSSKMVSRLMQKCAFPSRLCRSRAR